MHSHSQINSISEHTRASYTLGRSIPGKGETSCSEQMVEIRKGVFGYSGVVVAGPIDLTVNKREVVAIVGLSGCGKTTIKDDFW